LRLLGGTRAAVVCGEDGLDEVTLGAVTAVSEVTPQAIREYTWQPELFGLARREMAALQVDGPQASAEMIRSVLSGQAGPHRDIVLLNSAASLWIAGEDESLRLCCERAAEAIDQGAARQLLADLVKVSHS